MKFIENITFDDFEKMISSSIFENNLPIGRNVDNANRKPMNENHLEHLKNATY